MAFSSCPVSFSNLAFRLSVLGALACGHALPALRAQEPAAPARPNIVLIYADDLGYGDVSCNGATRVHTPNIDRLAKEGLSFWDGHAPASTCTPSRFSLLTGQDAFRTPGVQILEGNAKLLIRPGTTTLPSMLRQAGYHTGIIGKWHLGLGAGNKPVNWNGDIAPGPLEVGFDESCIIPATLDRVPCVLVDGHRVAGLDPSDPITVSYTHKVGNDPTGFNHPELLRMKADAQHSGTIVDGVSRIGYMSGGHSARWVDENLPDVLTKKATDFIHANRGRPFFLYFALLEPHVPRIPNPRFAGKTPMGPRGDVIVQLDWEVGQVLDALKAEGLADNTLVIFSSDNGPVLNDGYQDGAVKLAGSHRPAGPFRGGKYTPEEGGTRVPFIWRWPGHIKPGVSTALVSQIDFLASLAALTGQAIPKGQAVDSIDTLPAFLGQSGTGRPFSVEEGYRDLGFRLGDWKLVQTIKPGAAPLQKRFGKAQLYNVAADADVGEKKDLARRNPEKLKELQDALKAEIIKSGRYHPGVQGEVDGRSAFGNPEADMAWME